jgi:hypothetical protein
VNRRLRLPLALAAGSAALLFAAACGSDGGDSGTSTANGGNGFTAYLNCLREQGIDVPDTAASGQPRPDGSNRPTAFPSGRPTNRPSGDPSTRPTGGPGGGMGGPGGGRFRPEGVDDATWEKAQAACQSVMPTGGPGGGQGGPGGQRGGGRADTAYRNCLADAKTTEATKACEVLKPTPTPTA